MSEVRFLFDGREMKATAGMSVAAALISNGVFAWRETRHSSQPRGLFCGIGQCFDCLVTINGQTDIRACIDTINEGDVITTQRGHGHAH